MGHVWSRTTRWNDIHTTRVHNPISSIFNPSIYIPLLFIPAFWVTSGHCSLDHSFWIIHAHAHQNVLNRVYHVSYESLKAMSVDRPSEEPHHFRTCMHFPYALNTPGWVDFHSEQWAQNGQEKNDGPRKNNSWRLSIIWWVQAKIRKRRTCNERDLQKQQPTKGCMDEAKSFRLSCKIQSPRCATTPKSGKWIHLSPMYTCTYADM